MTVRSSSGDEGIRFYYRYERLPLVSPSSFPIATNRSTDNHDDDGTTTNHGIPPERQYQQDPGPRRLVANRQIAKDTLIFCERPLLALQSTDGGGQVREGVLVCHYCHCFVGTPEMTLKIKACVDPDQKTKLIQQITTTEYTNIKHDTSSSALPSFSSWSSSMLSLMSTRHSEHDLIPCRHKCGHVYCSLQCQEDDWDYGGHAELCTGWIPDDVANTTPAAVFDESNVGSEQDHVNRKGRDDDGNNCVDVDVDVTARNESARALLRFKRHALETNEIFLLIAIWLARILKQNAAEKRMRREKDGVYEVHNMTADNNGVDDDASSFCHPCNVAVSQMTDFCMKPWWDVSRNEIMGRCRLEVNKQQILEDDTDQTAASEMTAKAQVEADELDQTLRRLCRESYSFLSRAWAYTTFGSILNKDDDRIKSSCFPPPPSSKYDTMKTWLSPIGMSLLIGSLEQNCLGIRRKHPIRRAILHNDDDIRQKYHHEIVQCLANAGLIGDNDEGEEFAGLIGDDVEGKEIENAFNDETMNRVEIDDHAVNNSIDESQEGKESSAADEEQEETETMSGDIEEWDYSCEEIAAFLADMDDPFIASADDNWDAVFDPFDGTAHFSMISKMNHSCDPNVIVLYKTSGWGRDHPLVACCVALKDIQEGEELTISYIETSDPYVERQSALANYGFVCECTKCRNEMKGVLDPKTDNESPSKSDGEISDENDIFGEDSDNDDFHEKSTTHGDKNDPSNKDKLDDLAERVESYLNHSDVPLLPMKIIGQALNYVLKTSSGILPSFQTGGNISENHSLQVNIIENLLKDCTNATESRDFSSCRIVGPGLEQYLLHKLQLEGSWPDLRYRKSYYCAAVTAAIGYARECSFLVAMQYLDKAAILGLRRADIADFFDFVELFAFQMSSGPDQMTHRYNELPDYRQKKELMGTYLERSIEHAVEEFPFQPPFHFQKALATHGSAPLVIREMAVDWPAVTKWRSFDYMVQRIGRRLVPIEIGGMSTSEGMKEMIMEFREFVVRYLYPSTDRTVWSLRDATNTKHSLNIAYLAQHPLLDQIPSLYGDVKRNPCGIEPTNVNVWIGTGGTRTPLHFDSYDNFLVQIVGIKLVRLYRPNDTARLYVRILSSLDREKSKKRHDVQGNMSEVDCEMEDYDQHPLAKDCPFVEVLLQPGDLLFIPAGHWHYVRSLSTSISINYWF